MARKAQRCSRCGKYRVNIVVRESRDVCPACARELEQPEVVGDALWPREPATRYRVYAQAGGELRVLAAAHDPAAIGVAIVQLHEDAKQAGGRFDDLGVLGILDVMPGGEPSPTGEWVVTPFRRDERPATVGRLPARLER